MLNLPRIDTKSQTGLKTGASAGSPRCSALLAAVLTLVLPTVTLAQWSGQMDPSDVRAFGPTYPTTNVHDRDPYPVPSGSVSASVSSGQASPLIHELCQSQTYCDPDCLPLRQTQTPSCGAFGLAEDCFDCEWSARSYYLNDQRIQWSGNEETFGVEGVLAPVLRHKSGSLETTLQGEFYLNQPLDGNVYLNTQERRSYAANYEVDTLEISQLRIAMRNGNKELVVGKMATPFGRTYFPLYSNARLDAPFIRTESILWRETGLLFRWNPGRFVGELGLTNGSEDGDTNSSKSLVSRLGFEADTWAIGLSIKKQDGIGSEDQKQYNNHLGIDFMARSDRFTFSGEIIYDEYGFRRNTFDPNDITWGRSIYYRDLNNAWYVPITGMGYYLNLDYENGPWCATLNYGEFYPERIGNALHDVVNRRGIVKVAHAFTPHLQSYTVAMVETEGYLAQHTGDRRGKVLLVGLQYAF